MRRIVRLFTPLMVFGILGVTACSDSKPSDPGGGTAPAAATNVAATATGNDIDVTWTAPTTNVTSQRVELVTTGETKRTQDVGASATSATFTGLTDGATYAAQVFTINSNGETGSSIATAQIGSGTPTFVDVFTDVDQNTTWTADRKWVLNGPIFVGTDCGPDPASPLPGCNAVTLTIEPGTTILGNVNPPQGARGSYIVVSRGSKIIADANANEADKTVKPAAENVIVFTSSAARGNRARGDWGGLVVNGRAPINSGAEASGEGESGLFGGVDDEDSSGILRGVRVAFAGDRVTTTDELNGIALQGTGAGTTIDYVQVHYNVDDGTEPFGGSASQTHMVMTGIGDDSFDGTDGYRGFIQFAIAQQRGDNGDQGFEFSTNGDDGASAPQSTAVVANATLIGARDGEISQGISDSDDGIQLREGSNYRVFNTIVTNFGETGLCFEGAVTQANADNALAGETDLTLINTVRSTILWSNGPTGAEDLSDGCGGGYDIATYFNNAGWNNMVADPNLPASALTIGTMMSPPDFVPTAMPAGYTPTDVSAFNNEGGDGIIMPTDGRTLQATDYAGAVEPGTSAAGAWYAGWTVFDPTGLDDRTNQDDQ